MAVLGGLAGSSEERLGGMRAHGMRAMPHRCRSILPAASHGHAKWSIASLGLPSALKLAIGCRTDWLTARRLCHGLVHCLKGWPMP